MNWFSYLSYITIGSGILWVILYGLKKNNNFINVREIITNNFDIYREKQISLSISEKSKKKSSKRKKTHTYIFLALAPLLLAVGTVPLSPLTSDRLEVLITAIAIFIGFFFALLAMVDNKYKKSDENNSRQERINLVLDETMKIITFECLMSIFILVSSVAAYFLGSEMASISRYFVYIGSGIIYYLMFMMLLHLFIILKRISKLIGKA